jgi:hypothetical protein
MRKRKDNDCIISHSWLCTHPHFQHIAKCPEYLRSSAFVPPATIAVHQDWALGMSRVFLRAGQLKALEDLRSAGAAPDPEKLKIIMRQIIRKKWVRAVHAIGLCRYLPELLVVTKWWADVTKWCIVDRNNSNRAGRQVGHVCQVLPSCWTSCCKSSWFLALLWNVYVYECLTF